jgi:nitrogen fixation protein NifU and related proteins
MSDLYQEIILDQLEHPQHQGVLEGDDVLSRHELNASCGDEVTVYLKVADGQPLLLKWQGQGCAISMATMSLLADKVSSQRLTRQQVAQLKLEDLLELLGLDEISPGRLKCVMLGLKAIQQALASL